MTAPTLRTEELTVHYRVGARLSRQATVVRAVDGVSLEVGKGETVGLVGESGCGKSTYGRAALLLTKPTGGRVLLAGEDITALRGREIRARRRRMQMIFQDPTASLDPRFRVWEAITEPLAIHDRIRRAEAVERAAELLDVVGLPGDFAGRYPFELSGGQRQRVAIARALSLEPELVVCDEAVSGLDVSIRAQVVNLLADLQDRFGLSYLFIGHDLGLVRHVSHRIAVMYLGRIVELLGRDDLEVARHPYTRSLVSAIPRTDPVDRTDRIVLTGELPSPSDPPTGCHFHPRCPLAVDVCRTERPPLLSVDGPDHQVACHRQAELAGIPVDRLPSGKG